MPVREHLERRNMPQNHLYLKFFIILFEEKTGVLLKKDLRVEEMAKQG